MKSITSIVLGLSLLGLLRATPLPEVQVELLESPVDNPEETEGFFEGDIELDGETRNAVNTHYYRSATWPNGIVPYEIDSHYSTEVRNTYLQAMKEIEEDTKVHGKTCVKFVPKTSQHHDYIYILPQTGCHSPVGHHSGRGLVSLGHGCERQGTAMHEFLHVLGFWHEQNRYDRDKYVTINLSNVVTAQHKDFKIHTTHDMTTFGEPYDFGSIMHYGPYSFAIDKSIPTIIPKHSPGAIMGQRLALSREDVDKIQKLYNCGQDLTHIATPVEPTHLVECDFEHGITSGKCNLEQLHDDQFDWTLKTGPSGVSGSGPLADHTNGAGHYLLADARLHHNKKTRIQTTTLPSGVNCIEFSYFVHGSQTKTFLIRAEAPRIHHTIKQWSGSQTNGWMTQRINMNVPLSWKLVFEADIGSGDRSMMAIDDLKVYHGHCV
ncbi:hatching enzyme 1.2-like [Mytilus trossulus]|uniref:hatching enzyme 1.2-like n=1 Tax=Mytilus trossulus TaxID=6551 RepID=UPI003007E892